MTPYFDILHKIPGTKVLIDVGCHTGQFLEEFKNKVSGEVFSLGFDPLKKAHIAEYTHYYPYAVSTKEGVAAFHHYQDAEFPGMADSLAEINQNNITQEYSQRHEKVFIDRPFGNELGREDVKTVRIESILNEIHFSGTYIHFVKIDAQGTDIDCFESIGKYISQCLFVQIETIVSEKKEHLLYKNQLNFSEAKEIMNSYGFTPYLNEEEIKNSQGDWFERDVVFVNTKLFSTLGI